jgi:carboxymethylenebutenolidase
VKEAVMVEDWLANAYEGLSRREFLARMGAAGIGLAGFAMAATPVAGKVVRTSAEGLVVMETAARSGDFQVPVFEARPDAPGKYPVVIVIPEIFGMHEHVRDVTRRLGRKGFLAMTFEPYAREGGVLNLPDIAAVRKVVDAVPDERVMSDLEAVAALAMKNPAARPGGIGVTGFCRGGMYALLFAARSPVVKAVVSWYGQIRPVLAPGVRTFGPLDVAGKIDAPVLGLYGAEDLGIPVADVRALESVLKRAGKKAEFVVYPGAPHAFFADYRPSYRAEAAADAWERCIAWFNRYLAGP